MKRAIKIWGVTIGVLGNMILGTGLLSHSSQAQEVTFFCGSYQGNPATIARTAEGEKPMITWDTSQVGESPATPEELCQQVSAKIQENYSQGTLRYITVGRMNGQVVACLAEVEDGACVEPLFALNPDAKPNTSLQRIFQIRIASAGVITETNTPLYLDLSKYLNGEYPALDVMPGPSI